MPRFAAAIGLTASTAELDFVNVEITTDNRLYIDPYAIQIRQDEWSGACGDHIRSFFAEVLEALRENNDARAEHLFNNLHEPNETRLGQSKGQPRGRGIGIDKAASFVAALKRSRAFQTGLLTDIAEAELFIRNVGPDTISDLTTNIIRGKLAEYTFAQCELHNIATHEVADLGPIWSIPDSDWIAQPLRLPVVNGMPVLLTPRFSVRRRLSLKSDELWSDHMIAFMRQEYLNAGGALVQVFKSGKRHVYKKDVKKAHPFNKDELARFIENHPEVLAEYKRLKGVEGPPKVREMDEDFDERVFANVLVGRLQGIAVGRPTADEYHSIAMGIATFLFFPHLICPVKEHEIHQGRKRIDIKFTNAGDAGFFRRMLEAPQTRALAVFIECKNYAQDINNPELDQLTGRFGQQRGFFGMIFCRQLDDRARIVEACRDAANDGRGYMLPFEDRDVIELLTLIADGQRPRINRFLQDRFDEISH